MRYKGLVALGVVAVLGFAVATLPASLLGSVVERHGAQAASWRGTVWNGSADSLTLNGIALGSARWAISPWSLATGRLRGRAEMQPPDGSATSDFAVGFGGRAELTNVSANVPVAWLNAVTKAKFGGWDGRVSARFESLVFENGWPVAARGTVALEDLAAPASRGGRIGSYQLVFAGAEPQPDDGLQGRLTDIDGPLSVLGELSLGRDRSFDLQGSVAKRGTERTPFDQAIPLLGSPDESGRRPFGVSGTL
jgi:hypothetical protein